MVRVNRETIRQQNQAHSRVILRHYLNLIILAVIALAVVLYFYLLNIEEKVSKEEAVQAAAAAILKDNILPKQPLQDQLDPQQQLRAAAAGKTTTPDFDPTNTMIRSASQVLSAGLPFLVYGTAWKKDATAQHVVDAMRAGFRFIDTACQPKHYNEPGVGLGWSTAAKELGLQRSDVFLQTKFTSISGQDPNAIPYDQTQPLDKQVAESLQVSLRNLRTDYLDSWVMHSPMHTIEETMIVYRVMEQAVQDGKVKRLGISNCYDFRVFQSIYDQANIKPSVLQNRFYAESNFDQELRAFCKDHGIWYQSFWTLTANRHALATREAKEWATSKGLTPQTLMYAYLMSLGYGTPLDGTTSIAHMQDDIAIMQRIQNGEKIFKTEEDIRKFEQLLGF
jgi:diketogulonate reductase-like aldo/keto reductase